MNGMGYLTKIVVAQFGRPRGLLGRMAGLIMARRASNRVRNLWTVDQLGLQPKHCVLEVGFGPGLALAEVAKRVSHGQAVGLDHSEVMLRQAARRNRLAIRNGLVRLVTGSVEDLANGSLRLGGPFDRIFGVNVSMFWKDRPAALRVLADLLADDGILALTHQPRLGDKTAEAVRRAADELAADINAAGLSTEIRMFEGTSPPAVCVMGRRRRGDP